MEDRSDESPKKPVQVAEKGASKADKVKPAKKVAKSAVKVSKTSADPVAEDGGRRSGRTQRKVYSEPSEDDPFEE